MRYIEAMKSKPVIQTVKVNGIKVLAGEKEPRSAQKFRLLSFYHLSLSTSVFVNELIWHELPAAHSDDVTVNRECE